MGSLTRELVDEAFKGKFYDVHRNFVSKTQRLEMGTAVKCIIAICNACHANMKTVEKLNELEMVALLKDVLKFIHHPSDEQFQSYAQSVIYILRFLVEKGSFDCIIQLEQFFIPEFMPLHLTENHQNVYINICKSIYNVVVKFTQTKSTKQGPTALKLSQLLAKIYKKIDKFPNLVEVAHNCLLAFVVLRVSPEDILNFHSFIVKLLDRVEVDPSLYPLILNNLSFVFTHLLKEQRTDLAAVCFSATSNHLSLVYKTRQYEWLRVIMRVANWINLENVDKEALGDAHSTLKQYHRAYGCTANLKSVCEFMAASASTSLLILKKSGSWHQNMEVHEQFYKFLSDIALIIAKSSYKCPCNCSCSTNVVEAAWILDTIVGLGKLAILKTEVSRTYKMDIFRVLEKLIDFVRILKRNDCEKWTKSWYNCGVHMYTIGRHCSKDTEMLLLYLQRFAKTHLEFEGCKPTIVGRNYLNVALNAIGDSYFETRDYEKSLMWTGFAIVFSDNPKVEITRWIRAKASSRDNSIEENVELQELTIVDVLEKYHDELLQGGFPLSQKRKVDLLVFELRNYQAKWKSKLPMSVAFGKLRKLVEPQRAAEVFIEIWGDGDLQVHETLPEHLRDTIKSLERESCQELLLAHLHFLQHKYRVKEAIVKNCDEMKSVMSMMETTEPSRDPDAECDLVSSYESLRLSQYTKMMKHLETSLKLIHGRVKTSERLFKLLVNVGNEYALHGHTSKALEAFELALKAAETKLQRLQATGYIMEISSPVDEPPWEDLVQDHREDVISFLLSKSQAYFFEDFQTSYSSFLRARELSQPQVSPVLQARLDHLHHRFIMLPCENNVVEHEEYSLVKIHLALDKIRWYYTEAATLSSYDLRMFFDIHETAARMYFDLRLPREVRCYAREGGVLAQKLVLPLRTLTFLSYLAHADITTLRFDDSKVKLNDHSDILGITSNFGVCQASEVDVIAQDFYEMVLDDAAVRAKVLGSPSFVPEGFKQASFMSHQRECECFYCTCSEYQDFVLKNAYLHALFHEYSENASLAKDFFKGCQKVYKFLRDRCDTYRIKETYCYVLLEYANFLFRKDRLSDAKIINERALNKLESTTIRSHYLYNEIIFQGFNLLMAEEEENEKPLSSPVLASSSHQTDAKTPSPRSKRRVSPIPTIKLPQTIKVQPKILNFESSDEEEEKVKVEITTLPPFLIPAKTPAPRKRVAALKDACTPVNKALIERTKLLKSREKINENKKTENVAEGAIRRSARSKK